VNSRERFLAACAGDPVDRVPVWFMRQAGRYLPEYRAVRSSYGFQTMLDRPDLAAEVTLQPIQRFDLDAAIVFSDILVVLPGMGRDVSFRPAPQVASPVRTAAEIEQLRLGVGHGPTAETVARVRRALPDKAVLGFAGAPFTLATYLVEGGAPKDAAHLRLLARREPTAFARLLDLCARTARNHLDAQVEAGADAVQLFDTWAEALSPPDYERLALPALRALVKELHELDVPVLYFARGTSHLLSKLPQTGADVLSLDWRVDLRAARDALGDRAVQGNLDPADLLGPLAETEAAARGVAEAGASKPGYVFNLGHGILPMTDPANVEAAVKAVRGVRPA